MLSPPLIFKYTHCFTATHFLSKHIFSTPYCVVYCKCVAPTTIIIIIIITCTCTCYTYYSDEFHRVAKHHITEPSSR